MLQSGSEMSLPGQATTSLPVSVLTPLYSFRPLDARNYHIIDSPLLILPTTISSGYKSGISNASMTKDEVPLPAYLAH